MTFGARARAPVQTLNGAGAGPHVLNASVDASTLVQIRS